MFKNWYTTSRRSGSLDSSSSCGRYPRSLEVFEDVYIPARSIGGSSSRTDREAALGAGRVIATVAGNRTDRASGRCLARTTVSLLRRCPRPPLTHRGRRDSRGDISLSSTIQVSGNKDNLTMIRTGSWRKVEGRDTTPSNDLELCMCNDQPTRFPNPRGYAPPPRSTSG